MTAWTRVCHLEVLEPGRGVASLVGSDQVAVFLLPGGEIRAVGHHDPWSGANVIARGITGSHDGAPTVASPIHKQRFDLRTGRCLDDETASLPTYATRVVDGWVEVQAAPSPSPSSAGSKDRRQQLFSNLTPPPQHPGNPKRQAWTG